MDILIAGLPKSGTTGLLYLLFNSSKKRPRLIFEANECPNDLSSKKQTMAKILISPQLRAETFRCFEKKITLIRDPRDRLISALLYSQYHTKFLDDAEYVTRVLKCLQEKEQNPAQVSINDILAAVQQKPKSKNPLAGQKRQIDKSMAMLEEYLAVMPESLVYKYEDFVSENYGPLESYLSSSIKGKAKVPNRLERVCRTKSFGNWRDWFTEKDIEVLRPAVTPWLERFGYNTSDWELNANPSIDPEHCSQYFQRLIEEARAKQLPAGADSKAQNRPQVPAYIRKFRKLKKDPYDFFADSKNPALQQLKIFFRNRKHSS